MLEEVGGSALALGFVAGADRHPETDGRAPGTRHPLGEDPDAGRQNASPDEFVTGCSEGQLDRVEGKRTGPFIANEPTGSMTPELGYGECGQTDSSVCPLLCYSGVTDRVGPLA
ncbi:hypothetical protein GCM10025867_23890 [Frondihabitans sucicola]|uniref:Uncharacterized protein n=1 Tax=Frondihabitans sucicola TaxID=1268041 RepID=A0ABN6Y2C8_9MICO|nr:hypothetical protein GCM10025867_23890 [Frondihabitans sucicola]